MPAFKPTATAAVHPECELCREAGGTLVFQSPHWRVIRPDEPDFPAFYRVVWREHVAEWTDLSLAQQGEVMGAVGAVERVLRTRLAPAKINLASLGNMTPHVHWHVIARFAWDSRFPTPVWSPPLREVIPPPAQRLGVSLDALDALVGRAVAALAPAL